MPDGGDKLNSPMDTTPRLIVSKGNAYEVVRKLGEGYAGEVFEVRDAVAGRSVALKLLKNEAFAEGQLQAFKREFGALTSFHHPHICRVFDFGFAESDGRYFFTVELIQGEGLYAVSDRLGLGEVEALFVQITDALGFIHAASLIHFDIKGGNILVTEEKGTRIAKIVDFGLAAPPLDAPQQIVGTVRYMSPEMITRDVAIDYRADLYSLGIVLYRMLARRYPPQGVTMAEVFSWHVRHEALDPAPLREAGVPPYLVDVVVKLLEPVPTERFSSAPVVIRYIDLHSGRSYTKGLRTRLATLAEEGPLVGRADAMYQVRSAIHRLGQAGGKGGDTGQALVFAGGHGSGKSRMLKEARYLAQLAQLHTVVVRGREEGQDPAHVRSLFGLLDASGESAAEAKGAVAAILGQPNLCVMVDDLDACCPAVRELVTVLAGQLYASRVTGTFLPLLLMVTVGAPGEGLPAIALPGARVEMLSPLSREEIAQYVESFLGGSRPSPEQVEELFQYSGGVSELVRVAVASLEAGPTGPPRDALGFFADQIGQQSAEAQRALGALAVAERRLTAAEIEGLIDADAEGAIAELTGAGLVRYDRAAGAFELIASAIASAARSSLSGEEVKEIAGRLLAAAKREEPPDLDEVVRLARLSAAPEEVCAFLLAAADDKEGRGDLAGAAVCCEEALALMGESDGRAPALHRRLARHLILLARYDDAAAHIQAASRATGIVVEDLTSMSWLRRLQQQPEEALRFVRKAIDLLGEGPDDPGRLKLMNEEALCHLQMGQVEEAIRIFRESDDRAARLAEREQRQVINNNLGMALVQAGRFDEAIAFYREKHERFADDKRIAASVLAQLGYACEQAGDLDEALDAYRRSWDLASAVGDLHSGSVILGNIINICQHRALFSDALRAAEEDLAIASRTASEKNMAATFLTIGTLHINMGLEDVALRYLNEAARVFERLGDRRMLSWARLSLAHLNNNLGERREARDLVGRVIEEAEAQDDKDLLFWARCAAAEVHLDAGAPGEAAAELDLLDVAWPPAGVAGDKDATAELLRLKCAVSQGDVAGETARRLEELALSTLEEGSREMAGEAYHTLGTLFHAAGDDAASARALLRATEIYKDIASTLSEEYRDSFLRQKSRKVAFEDSVRLDRSSAAVRHAVEVATKGAAASQTATDETSELSRDDVLSETKDLRPRR